MTAYTTETRRLIAPPGDLTPLLTDLLAVAPHLTDQDVTNLRWSIRQRTELLREFREYFNVARTLIQDYERYQDATRGAQSNLPPQIAALLREVQL